MRRRRRGRARYRALAATRCFQWWMKASVSVGVFVPLPLAKGARMPSTADEDCAEVRKAPLTGRIRSEVGIGLLQSHVANDTPK